MEDIEKLKKIAKLSQEMRKHGFANYSDDAVKAAGAVYDGNIADAQTPEQRHQALRESKSTMANQPNDYEAFAKQTSQRLTEIETSVSTVIQKMNEMIKEINTLQKGGGASAPTSPPRERETQAPLPKPEPKPAPAHTEPHARSGNYSSQDVQIDKIFYFGNKKS